MRLAITTVVALLLLVPPPGRADVCGDGTLDPTEQCDDGNVVGGDCCDPTCAMEPDGSPCDDQDACTAGDVCAAGSCAGPMPCDDGDACNGVETCQPASGCEPGVPPPVVCGDGIACGTENCDDGNAVDGDGCDINCTVTACGNSVLSAGEECDDGNGHGCDGCTPGCRVEPAGASWCLLGGPQGGYIDGIVADPADPDTMYATTTGGVVRTVNGAQSWQAAEAGIAGAQVSGIAVSPADPSILLAGNAGQTVEFGLLRPRGIFRSLDAGQSWSLVHEVDPDPFSGAIGVGDVAFDPLSPSTAFAAAGAGIFRSVDAGSTWTMVSTVISCRVAVSTAGTILAGSIDVNSMLAGHINRSTDGGSTWTPVLDGLLGCPQRLSFGVSEPDHVLAATAAGVYRSLDDGLTWERVFPPVPAPTSGYSAFAVAVDPTDSQRMFAAIFGGCQSCALLEPTLFASTDGGDSWTPTGFGPTEVLDLRVAGSPSPDVFAGTALGVFASSDGGASWQARNAGLFSADIFVIVPDPTLPDRLWVGTGGVGLWRSDDAGATWEAVNQTEVRHTRALAIDPANPSVVYVGVYGDGVFKTTDDGASWTPVNTGMLAPEGYELRGVRALAIDPDVPTTLFAALDGGFFTTVDGAANWTRVDVGQGITTTAVAIGLTNPRTILVGASTGNVLYRSADGGTTWTPTSAVEGFVNDILIDPSDAVLAYVATAEGFTRSSDGGQTWSAVVDLGSPGLGLTALAFHPADTSTLYAASPKTGVYRSTDRGDTWELIGTTGLTTSLVWDVAVLPEPPLSPLRHTAAAIAPTSGHVLAVARGAGGETAVFRTSASGAPPWQGVQLLTGKQLVLKDHLDPAKRGATVQSKDLSTSLGGGNGSADDPVASGGSLRVRTTAGCNGPCDDTYPLDPIGWSYVGDAGENRGYKYRDRVGLVRRVVVKPAKVVKVVAKGALGHALGIDPQPVDVVLELGGRRYCLRFGGVPKFTPGRRFLAKDAAAPGGCAP